MVEKSIFRHLNPLILIPFILTEISTLVVGVFFMSVYVIILISAMPIYLFRFVLSKSSKYLNQDLGKMITARGQFLACDDFTSPKKSPRSNIIATLVLDGYVSCEAIRDKIQMNLLDAVDAHTGQLRFPEAKQYVTSYMGFKYWANDPQFKIENHVKVLNLNNRELDSTISWNELREHMETLLNQSFQSTRSPWEILLVHNYKLSELKSDSTPGNGTVIVVKLHHVLADGYGTLFTFLSAMSSKPPSLPEPVYVSRGTLRLLLFKLTFPIRIIRDISHFVVLSFKDSPLKVRDDKKAWKEMYQNSRAIPMEHIKEIKKRLGVSFTSVVHSCIAAAMEKCLTVKYGIKEAKAYSMTPCVIMLPLPDHPKKFRNYCTGAYLQLPTSNMDPVRRLRKCEDDIVSAKKSTIPFLGQYLIVIYGALFSKLAGIIGKNRSFPVSLSNFPLGKVNHDVCGHKAVHMYAAGGAGAGVAGLGFLVYSYVDSVQVSVMGEQGIFSRDDLDIIAKQFAVEINVLYNLVMV